MYCLLNRIYLTHTLYNNYYYQVINCILWHIFKNPANIKYATFTTLLCSSEKHLTMVVVTFCPCYNVLTHPGSTDPLPGSTDPLPLLPVTVTMCGQVTVSVVWTVHTVVVTVVVTLWVMQTHLLTRGYGGNVCEEVVGTTTS